MKIILLEQVKNLGIVGDIVEVKNGYARNFLIPGKKALRATKANIDIFEVQKQEIQEKNKEKIAKAEDVAAKIDGKFIVVIQQTGEDGRLYGSVTSAEIVKSLNNKAVTKTSVNLHNPIKYIGIYDVEIDIFAGVTANVKVNVAMTKETAKDAERVARADMNKAARKSSGKSERKTTSESNNDSEILEAKSA